MAIRIVQPHSPLAPAVFNRRVNQIYILQRGQKCIVILRLKIEFGGIATIGQIRRFPFNEIQPALLRLKRDAAGKRHIGPKISGLMQPQHFLVKVQRSLQILYHQQRAFVFHFGPSPSNLSANHESFAFNASQISMDLNFNT